MLEKAMAPHSSTLAWKIPWTEEPGGLQSMGLLRVGHDFTFTFTFHFHALEKEMATHSSVLAWRVPWTGELRSMGSHRVGHDWSDLAVAAADVINCLHLKKNSFSYSTLISIATCSRTNMFLCYCLTCFWIFLVIFFNFTYSSLQLCFAIVFC